MSTISKTHPKRQHAHLIGVTGTNGKTSTTRWVAAALSAHGAEPVACLDSLAWRVGDHDLGGRRDDAALLAAVASLEVAGGKAGVVELTSHALGSGLGRSLAFDVGVFTNLTQEHLELYRTYERYLACKAQLFLRLSAGATAVLNARDAASRLLALILPHGVEARTYGVPSRGPTWCEPDLEAVDISIDRHGTFARLLWKDVEAGAPPTLRLPALGELFVENALAALLAAKAAGVPYAAAAAAIAAREAPPGRFMRVAASPDVYVDVAHSPDAMARSLATARVLACASAGRVLLVFGSGGQRDEAKRGAMGRAASTADAVIVTSDESRGGHPADVARDIVAGMIQPSRACIQLNRPRAIEAALALARPEDVVLIAGRGELGAPCLGAKGLASDAALVRAALGGARGAPLGAT